jgi:predicted PurR-regulated permease PerM
VRSTLLSIQAIDLPLPALNNYVDQMVQALLEQIQPAKPSANPALPALETILQSLGTALTTTFGAAAGLVGVVVTQTVLVIFMLLASIHISLGAHSYRSGLLRAAPEAYRPEFAILLARIETLWRAFFRGQLGLMFLIGFFSWVGLMILGVPGALYLGIVAGLLEIIPSLGPVLASIPAIIVALLQGSTHFQLDPLAVAGLVVLFYVLLNQIENNIIVPSILGDAVELPPLVVIVGVLVGASVGGILGTFLATPVIASLREIIVYIYRKMQGKTPFPPREVEIKSSASRFLDWRWVLQGWRRLWRKPDQPVSQPKEGGPKPESGAEIFPRDP